MACTTGKNALQKGNYDASVIKSVDRLKSAPKNQEAIDVLKQAYGLAVDGHLRNVGELKQSSEPLRWEQIITEYQSVNYLVAKLRESPVAMQLFGEQKTYISEIEEAKYKSAEARYALGDALLAKGDRISAKQAYSHFERASSFVPNFKDVERKLDQAYDIALIVVVFQPANIQSNLYKLSNAYFQEQVSQFLVNNRQAQFVRFYSQAEANKQKIRADHMIQLTFDDFVVGQTYIKERVEKVKRDSVVIADRGVRGKVYGTVKATLSIFDKAVSSSGLLRYTIVDLTSDKVLRNQNLAGTFVWQDSWASFEGDSRALTKEQIALTRKKEILPPPPPDLFVEFTKPIYSQLTTAISNFYRNY